jgi:hypothetical protein
VLVEIARRLGVTPEELTGEVSNEQRTRSLEVLDAMMMIRLEQYRRPRSCCAAGCVRPRSTPTRSA